MYKQKVSCVRKVKMQWNPRALYKNSEKLISSQTRRQRHRKGYITRHWNIINGYWKFWIGTVVGGVWCAVSVILYKAQIHIFSPNTRNLLVLDVLNKEYYFSLSVFKDKMDFSECRSKEVMFLLMLCVIGSYNRALATWMKHSKMFINSQWFHNLNMYTKWWIIILGLHFSIVSEVECVISLKFSMHILTLTRICIFELP